MNSPIAQRLAKALEEQRAHLGAVGGVPRSRSGAQAELVAGPGGKPVKKTMLDASTPFLVPIGREALAASIFAGRYAMQVDVAVAKGLGPVRRVLDIGAGAGEFAAWAYKRFGERSWIDMIEYDPDLACLAELNGPPGSKLLLGGELDAAAYDVIRIGEPSVVIAMLPLLDKVPLVLIDVACVAPSDIERADRHEATARAWEERWSKHTEEVEKLGAEAPPIVCSAPMPYGLSCARPYQHEPPCLPDEAKAKAALAHARGEA